MVQIEDSPARSALIRADQPWGDALLAELYDVFPFDDDIPFYLDLAREHGNRVLEVACGSGRVLVPLASAGNSITGVDGSPHMLARTREKLAAAGDDVEQRVSLIQADMRSFAVDQQFDVAIIAAKSLAYLMDRRDQLATLQRVAAHLRPGGVFALDLLHPMPDWVALPDGSVRQDLTQAVPDRGIVVTRTETIVSTDLASQTRLIRSAYEIVAADGSVTKRFVEWPYRYVYRYEAEHLLERAGFEIEAVYGDYDRQALASGSRTMLFVAVRR